MNQPLRASSLSSWPGDQPAKPAKSRTRRAGGDPFSASMFSGCMLSQTFFRTGKALAAGGSADSNSATSVRGSTGPPAETGSA